MPSVTFRLPPALHERFVAHCETQGVKMSEVLSDAVNRIVDRLDDVEIERRSGPLTKVAVRPASAPDEPKPIGFAFDGSPIYPRTGSLQRPEKGAKK